MSSLHQSKEVIKEESLTKYVMVYHFDRGFMDSNKKTRNVNVYQNKIKTYSKYLLNPTKQLNQTEFKTLPQDHHEEKISNL